MKRKSFILAACTAISVFYSIAIPPFSSVIAADGPGSSGASYLNLAVGAKSIAMGEVNAALVGDPLSWMSNPALMHYMEGTGAGIFHAEWLVDTKYENLGFHHRVNDLFAVTCGFVYSYQPDMQGYDEFGVETSKLKSNNYRALIGFGFTPVESFTAGINVKYFNEKLAEWNSDGMAIDLGALYTFDRFGAAVGIAVQNLGPDITFDSIDEPLPTNIIFGASQSSCYRDDKIAYQLAFDLVKPRFEELFISIGGELTLHNVVAARVGYSGNKYRPGDGFSMGAGFRLRDSIMLDYAWTPYGDLGSFHRISLYLAIQ
jgi:hypothetical protein